MEAFLISTSIVALAEMGDKTQLLSLVLAAKFRKPLPIVAGIFAATLVNHALAGAVGNWITTVLGPDVLRWILGVSFILMAGWAAARSSPRLHHWLWQHRWFGPMLRDWAQGGRVSRRSKWHATLAMAMSAALLWLVPVPWWARALALGSMAVVLTWLWLRPEE